MRRALNALYGAHERVNHVIFQISAVLQKPRLSVVLDYQLTARHAQLLRSRRPGVNFAFRTCTLQLLRIDVAARRVLLLLLVLVELIDAI